MPWHVARSADCPPSKPWSVIRDADGSSEGCHATKEHAQRQLAALYANEPGTRGLNEPWHDRADERAAMSGKSINDLPDSAFAYIEPGGSKDGQGKTVPRSKRHFPIHDAAHVRNALARAPQSPFGDKAMPKIKAAAKKFGIEISEGRSDGDYANQPRTPAMTENLFRSFAPDLQVRNQGDGRTVYGIAVPYNAPTRIDSELIEQFARGAFNHQLDKPQKVKFAREHVMLGGELIGAASLLRDDAHGLYVELRAAQTPAGDSTLELVKEGALDQLSIMFRAARDRRLGGGVVERVTADLREVAIVMEGAYGELASAAGVRSKATAAVFTEADMALRQAAEQYLVPGAQPELRDYDLVIRSIKLGLPT